MNTPDFDLDLGQPNYSCSAIKRLMMSYDMLLQTWGCVPSVRISQLAHRVGIGMGGSHLGAGLDEGDFGEGGRYMGTRL